MSAANLVWLHGSLKETSVTSLGGVLTSLVNIFIIILCVLGPHIVLNCYNINIQSGQ